MAYTKNEIIQIVQDGIINDTTLGTDKVYSSQKVKDSVDAEATARENADDLLASQISANAGNDLFNYYNF